MKRWGISILISTLIALSGCAGMNPVSVAETPTQKADAKYDVFLVYKAAAVSLAQKPGTAQSTINALARADRIATPIMNSLQNAVIEVEKVRAEISAGNNTEETLVIVTNNLERWLLEAVPALQALIDAVAAARKEVAYLDTGQSSRLEWRYA